MQFEITKVIYDGMAHVPVGKEVYYANDLLELMNTVCKDNRNYRGKLMDADTTNIPFRIMRPSGDDTWAKLIYPIEETDTIEIVKEPVNKPLYRPFENVNELLIAWDNMCIGSKRPFGTMPIIWVRYKKVENDAHAQTVQMITAFCENGVEMGAEFVTWDALFNRMEFLNGNVCGIING